MNNREILKAAIEKAIKNGWDIEEGFNTVNTKINTPIDPNLSMTRNWIMVRFFNDNGQEIEQHLFRVLFDHDFARAFWGYRMSCPIHEQDKHTFSAYCENYKEGEVVPDDKLGFNLSGDCDACGEKGISRWKCHLQHMVLEKDPIQYLARFLK